jgi:glycyl-tRNA synthetase alpha chain
LFNILDASNSIGVTERTAYILRVRQLAVGIAKAYVAEREPPDVPAGQSTVEAAVGEDAS